MSCPAATGSSRSSSPAPAGSSTSPTTSGRRPSPPAARRWPAPTSSRPASASPTSARPPSSGTAAPCTRRGPRSSGRTGAPPPSATGSAPTASRSGSPSSPGCGWTRTSPAPSTPGWPSTSRGCGPACGDGALALGTVDSYVIARLTGGAAHVTDPSNASRTLLYDLGRAPGPTSCAPCSTYRPPRCPTSSRAPASSAPPTPTRSSACRCRSPASRATSRRRCSGRPATPPA